MLFSASLLLLAVVVLCLYICLYMKLRHYDGSLEKLYGLYGMLNLVGVLQTKDFEPELIFSHPTRIATLLGRDVVLPATLPVLLVAAGDEVQPENHRYQMSRWLIKVFSIGMAV